MHRPSSPGLRWAVSWRRSADCPPPLGRGLGLAGVFCGVTNCPLTSILLAYELFGGAGLPLYALCCAVSYMLSGYCSLYGAQKILYSKFRAEYIAGNR